jgi:hypothetical protein
MHEHRRTVKSYLLLADRRAIILVNAAPPRRRSMDVAAISARAARGEPAWSAEDTILAVSLFTVWAIRTGRALPDAAVTDLTPEELTEFWADDQLDEPCAAPAPERLCPGSSARCRQDDPDLAGGERHGLAGSGGEGRAAIGGRA